MTISQRWAAVKSKEWCDHCLKHSVSNGKKCFLKSNPGGGRPCGQEGCVEMHHPLLHRQTVRAANNMAWGVSKEPANQQEDVEVLELEEEGQEKKPAIGEGELRPEEGPLEAGGEEQPIKKEIQEIILVEDESEGEDQEELDAFTFEDDNNKSGGFVPSKKRSYPFVNTSIAEPSEHKDISCSSEGKRPMGKHVGRVKRIVPMLEEVEVMGHKAVVLYDTGSALSLVKAGFMKDHLVPSEEAAVSVVSLGRKGPELVTRIFNVNLMCAGKLTRARLVETPEIKAQVDLAMEPFVAAGIFQEEAWRFSMTSNKVDIIIGLDNASTMPTLKAMKGGLRLYDTRIGKKQGLLVGGCVDPEDEEMRKPLIEAQRKEDKRPGSKRQGLFGPWGKLLPTWIILLLSLFTIGYNPAHSFVAFDCQNATNVVQAFSLLEPDHCAASNQDARYERIIQGEIVQLKRTRTVPVFHCIVQESVFSQYCGHTSAAGITRYLKFREPKIIEPMDCRQAQINGGKILVGGKAFNARIGTTTSHVDFVAGDLDDAGNCATGTVTNPNTGAKFGYQTAQQVFEITLSEQFASMDDMTGNLRLPGDILARAADMGIKDSLAGTFVWDKPNSACPDTLVQLYRGVIKVYANVSTTFSGGVAMLEEKNQVAGLELGSSFLLCSSAAYRTHLRDVVVIVHPDNYTAVARNPFDPSVVSDITRLESEMSFLHIKAQLSQREKLKQIKAAICENRREIAASRLEAVAGSENQYSLITIFGRGHMTTRAGCTVYVTKCNPVSVTPRQHANCTQDIPVTYNGTELFVDPVSLVLKTMSAVTHCNDVAPPRWLIAGKWYCSYPAIRECHAPDLLPLSPLEIIDSDKEGWGLGRSIYTPQQIEEFHLFQQSQAARNAYVAESTELAYIRRGPDGQWGLGLGERAQEAILDSVGNAFIPLYRFFGPIAMIMVVISFCVGFIRIAITLIIRSVVIMKVRGCGIWMPAALTGTMFQLAVAPLRWIDRAAKDVATRVETTMMMEATEADRGLYPVDALREQVREEANKPVWEKIRQLIRHPPLPPKVDEPCAPKEETDPLQDKL